MTDTTPTTQNHLMPSKIIYGLYALGYFTGGLTWLAGVIYAYLERGKDALLDTHLRFQIRTFWISLLLWFVGLLGIFALGLGYFMLLFLVVWGITRIISGFLLANEGKPVTGTRYLGLVARDE